MARASSVFVLSGVLRALVGKSGERRKREGQRKIRRLSFGEAFGLPVDIFKSMFLDY